MELDSGYFYHIYNRGNNAQTVFYSRENYLFFLEKMKKYISPFASIISWCLMPNHFHWLIFVRKKNELEQKSHADYIKTGHALYGKMGHALTSRQGMTNPNVNSHTLAGSESMTVQNKTRTINQSIGICLRSYTRAIQKQEKFTGSLFQKHTHAKLLIDDVEIEPSYWNTSFGTQINIAEGRSYLETCIEYIHQNPVVSKLVEKADDWEFSSMKDFLGVRKGKLIDYDLLIKENLLPKNANPGYALTSRQGGRLIKDKALIYCLVS